MSTNRALAVIVMILEVFVIIVGIYGIFAFSQNQKEDIKYKAIDECMKISINVKPGELIEYVYKLCLKDKGLK